MIQVKVFDEQHEEDLTESLNEFLVALDEKDKPTEIPGLLIETEEEKWEWDAAKKRREMRMKRREEGF